MGILQPKKPPAAVEKVNASKRRSMQDALANLKPLKAGAAANFTGLRESTSPVKNGKKKPKDEDEMDSDADDEDEKLGTKTVVVKDEEDDQMSKHLNPDDMKSQGELSSGVQKMRVRTSLYCTRLTSDLLLICDSPAEAPALLRAICPVKLTRRRS